MSTLFTNYERIIANGDHKLRADALEIAEAGIRRVIPYEAVRRLISCDDSCIRVGSLTIPWDRVNHIYVVGAGKGSFPIAQALDEIFGERIKAGTVIVKDGEKRRLPHIEIFESSHPIPDARSIEAADKLMRILSPSPLSPVAPPPWSTSRPEGLPWKISGRSTWTCSTAERRSARSIWSASISA